jgi:hypothetical protein
MFRGNIRDKATAGCLSLHRLALDTFQPPGQREPYITDSIDRQFPFRLSERKREPRGFGYRARIGYISPSVIGLNAHVQHLPRREYAMLKKNEPFRRQPRQRLMAVPGRKKVTEVSGHPPGVMVPG